MEQTKRTTRAFTLVETMIAMTLIAIIFLMIMQAFNSILIGSYLVDARTAVRNESEFVSEYFELRIKNADPRGVRCNNTTTTDAQQQLRKKSVSWSNLGSSTKYTFWYDDTINPLNGQKFERFCINTGTSLTTTCQNVLTYNDVRVHSVEISCEEIEIEATREVFTLINLTYKMDSKALIGERPAVRDVSRHISISLR